MASTNDDSEEMPGLLPCKRAKTVDTCENKPLEDNRSSRSRTSKINWSLCIFCQKSKHKGVKTLINVSSFDACQTIISAAEARGDHDLLTNIRGLDLIAAEAKYHSACRASYVSKSNLKHQAFKEEDASEECLYDKSFKELLTEIESEITAGKAYDMSYLLERYKEILFSNGISSQSYRSEKLKKRLINHFSDSVVFHKQQDPSKPELIYSSSISVQSLINAASSFSDAEEYLCCSPEEVEDTEAAKMKVLFQAAQILKTDIKQSTGICIHPLSVDDISLQTGRQVIPDSFYNFLCWFVSQQDHQEAFEVSHFINQEDERRVLMLGQDMVHASTHSRIKTPKHVGLGITVHHLTGSKQLVTLLNKMGHCCSYDDVELITTSLAREISARSEQHRFIVPSNLSPGLFVQFAADNNDLNEETLDGKNTTHATTIVAYQRKAFGPELPPQSLANHSSKRRSLETPLSIQTIHDFGVRGRRPAVTSFLGKVKDIGSHSDEKPSIDKQDFSWFLLRLNKCNNLLSTSGEVEDRQQTIPSWSAFNAVISDDIAQSTNVGYCPMIAGSATEFSTIYTVLKTIQGISTNLGQTKSVVTFDLAIYNKAKEIQWRRPDEFKQLIIRLGGFHIALNYLSVIGKKFEESGIEELLVESGLYGTTSTIALLKGKSYNRGVRAHKLIMEALLRLQWQAFCRWLERSNTDTQQLEAVHVDQVQNNLNKCKAAINAGLVKDEFDGLCDSADNLRHLFHRFHLESHSQLFKFRDSYIKMVVILLRFIRAEREANWKLHLQSTAEMVPHFFSMDRTNYSRWLPIYLADMKLLEQTAPEVHDEFIKGNHAVSRSSQPFNQIWTDMALEQSINRDSKIKGGIVGISQKPGALERWFVTAHERAAVTTATKELCGVRSDGRTSTHKEGGSLRVKRDEEDVTKLVSTLETVMVNPFEEGSDGGDTISLSNLATGVVMPTDMSSRLLDAEKLGEKEMNAFIEKRINSNAVGFWDALPKMKIKTFASLAKKVQIKESDEELVTINVDRSLFGRLLIASKSRNIDLRDVLRYELSPVPCALAHTDGTLRKSNKSVLLAVLEDAVQVLPGLPCGGDEPLTATIIDGMAAVQMVKTAGARTFGEMASRYFNTISAPLGKNNCSRVDVVFDRYDKADSIKESERRRRGSTSGYEIKIAGPNTAVPKNWNAYITNPVNKMNFQHFLGKMWTEMGKNILTFGHQLILAGCFTNPDDVLIVERGTARPLPRLASDQEEADSRMMLHAEHCSHLHKRVVVHSPDTDVAVLATHIFTSLSCEQLWMKTGVRDRLRYIPIHALVEKLGPVLCNLLPAFHALTGCDTTSGPYLIGKKKSWKVLKDSQAKFEALRYLGEVTPPSPDVSATAEQYLCSLYSTAKRAGETADDVRYWIFCQKKQRNEGLPPTSNSIQHHIQRANYQTMVWMRCLRPMQELPSPFGNGWEMCDNMVKPVLMSKEAAPVGLVELTVCKCDKSSCRSNQHCICRNNEMPCTEGCGCMGDESCQNPHTTQVFDDSSDEEM